MIVVPKKENMSVISTPRSSDDVIAICNALGETPDYYLIGTPTKNTDSITALIKTLPQESQDTLLALIQCYINRETCKKQANR